MFFEHTGNRAVRKGDWKLVSASPGNKWELYNIKNGRSELIDLSTQQRLRVQELEKLYYAWAARSGVLTGLKTLAQAMHFSARL